MNLSEFHGSIDESVALRTCYHIINRKVLFFFFVAVRVCDVLVHHRHHRHMK